MLEAAGFQKMVFEDFYDVLVSLMENIVKPDERGQRLNAETLLEAFQSPEGIFQVYLMINLNIQWQSFRGSFELDRCVSQITHSESFYGLFTSGPSVDFFSLLKFVTTLTPMLPSYSTLNWVSRWRFANFAKASSRLSVKKQVSITSFRVVRCILMILFRPCSNDRSLQSFAN